MEIYLNKLVIEDVRGLHDIEINLSDKKSKHLILTGKNGSGKTSVLDAIANYLNCLATSDNIKQYNNIINGNKKRITPNNENSNELFIIRKNIEEYSFKLAQAKQGVDIVLNINRDDIFYKFKNGEFIIAYYQANRVFNVEKPQHVEKIQLKETYEIKENARKDFVKFLLDLKMTQALALSGNKVDKANTIGAWFVSLENMLKEIFDDKSLEIVFDEETFLFSLKVDNKPPFDFNTLSSGYAAILDIVVDVILKMQNTTERKFVFDMPGIVLIDEIKTHLHVDLQKQILGFLTTIFPNIQFILTTHSPFILSSLKNVVIYDLEKQLLVEHGLSDVSYSGIIEGYFNASEMSNEIQIKFNNYKNLVSKKILSDDDFAEIARLELVLNEIPDFLSIEISTEYLRLKLEFEAREDL